MGKRSNTPGVANPQRIAPAALWRPGTRPERRQFGTAGLASWLIAAALALSGIAPAQAAEAPAQAAPLVTAPAGAMRGDGLNGVNRFGNIPYALPPVGERRWRPPVAAPDWEGVRDARGFGPICHQPGSRAKSIYTEALPPMSEDCLSLNVWAPKDARGAPVFVWIHGGSLVAGSGRQMMYDGAAMARRGIVVVTINYRLGILGYLAHPELSAESPDHLSGNYGLMDQIAALEWVKRNIGAFGGDAGNVTVAGESAGALSVMYLMAAPQARGLFDRAIMQSAYMVSAPALKTASHGSPSAETIGAALMHGLGANDLAAMRAKSATELVEGAAGTAYFPFPSVDGRYVPDQLVAVFDRGEQARVPIIAGSNSGEIRSLRFLAPPPPASADAYTAAIRASYGDLADTYLRLYPPGDLAETMLLAPRDALYSWTAERLVRSQRNTGQPGYLYYFDHSYPEADRLNLHGFHASEIPYALGNIHHVPPAWPQIPDTPQERALSQAMLSYWTSFARTGVPRAEKAPSWSPFGNAQAYMRFAGTPVAATHPLPGVFELHEQVVCRRRAAGDVAWNWNVGIIAPPISPKNAACR